MAKTKTTIPNYGTVTRKGIQYFRTRITDADGKRVAGCHQKNNPNIEYTIDFDVTPHTLRRTYITNLLYAGVDPKTVQYLAGHENSKTTMDIYAKLKYNKPEELLNIVNAAFGQQEEAKNSPNS